MDEVDEPFPPDQPLGPPGTPSSRGAAVARNSVVVLVTQYAMLAIGFVLTPFILHQVGLKLFGFWSFVTVAIGYIAVLDPGFGTIVIRFGSRADAEGNPLLPARLSTLGIVAWLSIGVVASPLLLLCPVLVAHAHLGGTHLSSSAAVTFLCWGYGYLFFDAGTAILSCRFTAAGEQWVATLIGFTSRCFYAVAVVVVLVADRSIWGLALATTLQTTLTLLATVVLIRRRYGRVFASPRVLGRERRRELLRFGGFVQLSGIFDALNYDTDYLVLLVGFGAATTGIYTLAQKMAGQVTGFVSIPQQSLLQAFSAADAESDSTTRIRDSAVDASKLMGFAGFFAAGAMAATAPVLMPAYLGRAYPQMTLALVLLCALQLVNASRYNCAIVIVALGRAGLGAWAKGVAVVVNLVLTISLGIAFGMAGVLLGTIGASAVQSAIMLRRYVVLLETDLATMLWQWYGRIAVPTAVAGLLTWSMVANLPEATHHQRGPALLGLVLGLSLFGIVFGTVTRLIAYFHRRDLDYLARILPGPLGKIALLPPLTWLAPKP